MNLATGTFDMFFNYGGWKEFLANFWPVLLVVLVGAGLLYGYIKSND